jgi:O-antigen ligase
MSNEAITYLVGACCGVFGLAAYVAWILVPAWTAYSRWWERLAAAFLSLYVLAAMVGVGLLGGAAVVWFYDRWAA